MSKKKLTAKVISNKMEKTVVVEVEMQKKDPKYKRIYLRHKKYKAHDENKECKVGDIVTIEESRPISKDKKWRVIGKNDAQKEVESHAEKRCKILRNSA